METKKQMRCKDTLRLLMNDGHAVFFTLTTPDEVDFGEIRRRWRILRHDLIRDLRKHNKHEPLFVMNYERHPGYLQKLVKDDNTVEKVIRSDGRPHGWHIHGVINCRIPLRRYRAMLNRSGFGRVDVRRVNTMGVADYLTKHALKAYRGLSRLARARMECQRMRLVNVSRGLPALSEYVWRSDEIDRTRAVFRELVKDHKDDYGKIINPLKHWRIASVISLLRLSSIGDFQRLLEKLEKHNVYKC